MVCLVLWMVIRGQRDGVICHMSLGFVFLGKIQYRGDLVSCYK